jgi:GT2 family glycosyltransferase
MRAGKVSVATLFNGAFACHQFNVSLMAAQKYDSLQKFQLFDHPASSIFVGNADDLASKRNRAVEAFLQADAEWLVFIDDDQVFDPDAIHRLIADADPVERPILSAVIIAERGKGLRFSPACAAWDGKTFRLYNHISTDHFWRVGSVGTGFVAIHRTVLEAIAEKHADDAWRWFKFAQWVTDGKPDILGEDYTFSLRAQALGYSCHVDTRVHVGHVKQRVLTARDFWDQFPAEQLPPEVVAIIPVKDKLHYTKQLVAQLQADPDVAEIVVIDNGSKQDTKTFLAKSGVTVIDAPGAGIHTMWNMGINHAFTIHARPYTLILNNDIRISEPFAGPLRDSIINGPGELVAVCPNYDERIGAGVERLNGICGNRYDGTGGLAGFAFMVRPEWWQTGWRFDENLTWWYGDNDFTLEVESVGAYCGMTHAATAKHLDGGGQTGKWDDPEMQAILARDGALFQAKWQARVAP